jgi:hypothetical protein
MIFINQILAADSSNVDVTKLINEANPAPKLAGVTNLGGLLTGGGFNLINFIFIIVGLIFFINLIMAGWEYMLSSGDPKKVQAATARLTNGFVGLIMAVLAFVIVRLITTVLGLGPLV